MVELWEVLEENFPDFASGYWLTVRTVAISFVIALVVGTVVANLRVAPLRGLRFVGTVYVEFFRGVPLLILLTMAFAGLRRAGVPITATVAGPATLGLYTAAYVAEILRSGFFAVGKGQREASLSLGLDRLQTMRYVVLPQAFRTVIPPLASLTVAMIKNSAIIGGSILATEDLLKVADNKVGLAGDPTPLFFWAAVGYLTLTIGATVAARKLETRYAVRR